jgi:hypothetical protein
MSWQAEWEKDTTYLDSVGAGCLALVIGVCAFVAGILGRLR